MEIIEFIYFKLLFKVYIDLSLKMLPKQIRNDNDFTQVESTSEIEMGNLTNLMFIIIFLQMEKKISTQTPVRIFDECIFDGNSNFKLSIQ